MIPVDPRPLTLRQLLLMIEGAQRARWSRTSAMMALIANVNRDPRRSRPYKPQDFDPFEAEAGPTVLNKNTIRQLMPRGNVTLVKPERKVP